jgi:ribosome-binding factor A
MSKRSTARDYPRTARLNTLVRQIFGEELERIDDERLEFVTFTSVKVDGDLKRAIAYYDHSQGDDADDEVQATLEELRYRFQKAIAQQARLRNTPEVRFELDSVLRSAERIERVLRDLDDGQPGTPSEG